LIVIKWYGAFRVINGKIVEEYIFPEERRIEILKKLRRGDYSPLVDFIRGEEVRIEGEINDLESLKSLAVSLARDEMRETLGEDYILIQILNTYNDAVSILNLMKERALEWERIERIKGSGDPVAGILKKRIEDMERLREELYQEIERRVNKIAPNLAHLVGPIIAATLISDAGSLKRLANLPASTIQVLGAEDAFFRHLKTGAKCPKHGTIFKVAEVRNAPRKLRGRIARSLAAKIAIAARVDYYRGAFVGDVLRKEFEKRVEEIKNDNTGKSGGN